MEQSRIVLFMSDSFVTTICLVLQRTNIYQRKGIVGSESNKKPRQLAWSLPHVESPGAPIHQNTIEVYFDLHCVNIVRRVLESQVGSMTVMRTAVVVIKFAILQPRLSDGGWAGYRIFRQ